MGTWNGAVTQLLKKTVGRPRPDFFGRCIGNSNLPPIASAIKWASPGYPLCTGSGYVMEQAYMSFPSGHSSTAFAGLSMLTLFLISRFHLFKGSANGMQYMLAFAPLVIAAWVAATRVIDYWHNPTDVIAGGVIGFTVTATVWQSQLNVERFGKRAANETELKAPVGINSNSDAELGNRTVV